MICGCEARHCLRRLAAAKKGGKESLTETQEAEGGEGRENGPALRLNVRGYKTEMDGQS